ncbi:hypothetical protein QCA50_011106 [Cerrena zonata]|uniref:Uncharacterized protein n=1 Tax=Cerrena zonata TaxID=2478898 RepID=A0AAW0G3P2_9APHY
MLPKLDVAETEAITKELDPIKAISDAFVQSLETDRDSIIQTLEAKREELDRQIEAWKAETDKRVEARKLEDLCAMRVLNRSLNQHSIICRIPPKLLGPYHSLYILPLPKARR